MPPLSLPSQGEPLTSKGDEKAKREPTANREYLANQETKEAVSANVNPKKCKYIC